MKNIRKITAVLLAAVLLLGVVPAALGESYSDFVGTHWYANRLCALGMDYSVLCPMIFGIPDPFTTYLVKFVPYASQLTRWSLCSFCCTLDFSKDGTYELNMGISFLGNLKEENLITAEGTWSVRGGELVLDPETDGGVALPIVNGTLRIATSGCGFILVKA